MTHQPTDSQSDQIRAALEAAAELAAISPAVPYAAGTDRRREWPRIGASLHFYATSDVRAFAAAAGAEAGTERPVGSTRPHVVARGVLDGVPYIAWSPEPEPADLPTPVEPASGAEVPPDASAAAKLARLLSASQPDVTQAHVVDATTITVHVSPPDGETWRWWLARFRAWPDSVTRRGTTVTAIGTHDGVTVHLIASGLGQLQFPAGDAQVGEVRA